MSTAVAAGTTGDGLRAAVVGASGYVGGELLRLLLAHPELELVQATSERNSGQFVHSLHPNLRGTTKLKFTSIDQLGQCDVLFVSLPHGTSMDRMPELRGHAPLVIDMGADFRLDSHDRYVEWYGGEHRQPELLSEFVYGLPEINRQRLRKATAATGTGCSAATCILALHPLTEAGVVDDSVPVFAEVKFASSAAGATASAASHHPERSGILRSFQPVGHRHTGEIEAVCGVRFEMSATSYDSVRGILATLHVTLDDDLDDKQVWQIYRQAYQHEPFVRIVKEKHGIHRFPEPKILAGSNFCDIGFARDPRSRRLVVIAALDNLMKGAAGNAIQALNVMRGYDERAGLGFPGLHPT